MFNNLLKLIKRNSQRTPLEDFTTELLVEMLNNLPALKKEFCNDFLGLESDTFMITSQARYGNSIVDIEIKGENEICFIENKVNSKEGFGFDKDSNNWISQLEKYSKILDGFDKNIYNTKLIYCTKRNEPKEFTKHSFKAIKWYHIAQFLEPFAEEKLVKLFIDFLKTNDMAHDMRLESKDIIAIENFGRIFLIMNKHMERVKSNFESLFINVKDARRGKNFKDQLERHSRFCIYSENPIKGEGWSDILYSFDFEGYINTGLFIHKNNPSYSAFKKILDSEDMSQQGFLVDHDDEIGSSIYMKKKLASYINEDDSEIQIEQWFKGSFKKIDAFRQNTKGKIDWI